MADEQMNAGKVVIFPTKTTVGLCPSAWHVPCGRCAFKCRRTYKTIGRANCALSTSPLLLHMGKRQHMWGTGMASVKLPLKMHN